ENIARRIAVDRARKKDFLFSRDILEMEKKLSEALGTRVMIEPKEHGGKISIDFAAEDDLRVIFNQIAERIAPEKSSSSGYGDFSAEKSPEVASPSLGKPPSEDISPAQELDDRSAQEKERDENTFNPENF